MKRFALSLLFCLLLPLAAGAQFYSEGSEPARGRWRQFRTPAYRVVFPEGMDSLARVYVGELERFRGPVSRTAGYEPNQKYRRPMPVILHADSEANGMVAWTPRRMELFTIPEAYSPEPLSWPTQLAVHEGRHVAQMQFVRDGIFGIGHVLTGQLLAGMATALYGGSSFFEGDAVVAETALTPSGRGRTADFLSYYRISFAQGDYRNYWRWRYGSLNAYSPNHYALGYLLTSGMRTRFDAPYFTADYYRRIFNRKFGLPFFNLQKTVREDSGLRFRDAFRQIQEHVATGWAEEEAARGPFTPTEAAGPEHPLYTRYGSLCFAGDSLWAVRAGLDRAAELVRIDPDGTAHAEGSFAGRSSRLSYSPATGRLFWTESLPHPRWEFLSISALRYRGRDGKKHTLRSDGHLYNPAADPASDRLSVSAYFSDGKSALQVLSARDGALLQSYPAPDGLQVLESAWTGSRLFVSAVSEEGIGIYEPAASWRCILPPQPVKIKALSARGGELLFLSDRNGADNLYALEPVSERVDQLGSLRFGASSFAFSPDSSALLLTEELHEGRLVRRIETARLERRSVDFSELFRYADADRMTAQEPQLPGEAVLPEGEAQRYSRLAHLIKLHSWVPFYLRFNDISAISSEDLENDGSLGATVLFQNDLGTMRGSAGYSLGYDLSDESWRHGAHLQAVYSGLYPVIEANLDLDSGQARHYFFSYEPGVEEPALLFRPDGAPSFLAEMKAYVPLDFSSGGWSRGVLPSLQLRARNDRFTGTGGTVPVTAVTAAVRAYAIRDRATSAIFPRWGLGAEAGAWFRPGLSEISTPYTYLHLYSYLPGFARTHGLRLIGDLQCATDGSGRVWHRLEAEYALPFAPVDWTFLCPLAYVRNFELRLAQAVGSDPACTTVSLCARLGNFLWIPYGARMGFSLRYDNALPGNEFVLGGIFEIDI
ncbi:MAG: hypothetical protein IJV01_00105 [Bacteroidales bacterium]|nr:hypothetical protein [Bacteroidales bacterium]